jgi:hypothetical protein
VGDVVAVQQRAGGCPAVAVAVDQEEAVAAGNDDLLAIHEIPHRHVSRMIDVSCTYSLFCTDGDAQGVCPCMCLGDSTGGPVTEVAMSSSRAISREQQFLVAQRSRSDQVNDFDVSPFAVKAFGYKSTMTLFRCMFAAKKARRLGDEARSIEDAGHIALVHQGFEVADISRPDAIFTIGSEDFLRRGKSRLMDVGTGVGQVIQEKWQVAPVGKARQLTTGVESRVHQPSYPGVRKEREEPFRAFLREANGVDRDGLVGHGGLSLAKKARLSNQQLRDGKLAIAVNVHNLDIRVDECLRDQVMAMALLWITLAAHDRHAVVFCEDE